MCNRYRPATITPHQQDKRAVVSIERDDWDQWLDGTAKEALALVRLPDADLFVHGAAEPEMQVELPLR